jgi:hypothetical protein
MFIAPQKFHKREQLTDLNIRYQCLYQIHGAKSDRGSLVFTVPQYIERYQHPKFTDFLKDIFNKHTVLFVGYGLSEFEILDYVIEKYAERESAATKRQTGTNRYTLQGYQESEVGRLELDCYYYAELGLTVIPYRMSDSLDHKQQVNVLRHWGDQKRDLSLTYSDIAAKIESIE